MALAESRRSGALLVSVVTCLVLAACSGSAPPVPAPTGLPDAAPALETRPSASDGGTAVVDESGFTPIPDDPVGGATDVVWAVELENTSETDLLALVAVEATWTGAQGETEVWAVDAVDASRDGLAYDVLPGTAVLLGGEGWVNFPPESLDVQVRTTEWYPMSDLAADGVPVGVEVHDFSIEATGNIDVRARFTSAYDTDPGDLRMLVGLRDASGALLGAIEADIFPTSPSGEREESFYARRTSLWPDR